jgi:hypothetical protein
VIDRIIKSIVRNWIRSKLLSPYHQAELFRMINEEAAYVWHEDNLVTRTEYLKELIEKTSPRW